MDNLGILDIAQNLYKWCIVLWYILVSMQWKLFDLYELTQFIENYTIRIKEKCRAYD